MQQEIIERLISQAGLSAEQARKALETIAEFVKEKYPMVSGAIDNLFGSSGGGSKGESVFGAFGGFGE